MKNLNWRQWTVVLAFLLVVAGTVFFAVRSVRPAIYWHYHQDEPICGWMNVGLGEVLLVVLYVMLGYIFSDRVQYSRDTRQSRLGDLGLIVALILGWKVMRYLRPASSATG